MYKTLSNDYDRFVNWKGRLAYELPFIEKQISSLQSTPGQALEILDSACGTAMHSIALAQLGHRLSAADLVPEMVAQGRLNVKAAGITLDLKTAGFGELKSKFGAGRFDLLLCLGNSLPHVLTDEDLVSAITDFAACLRPGRMVLIQNRNFDAVMEKKERWMEPQVHTEHDSEWIFQRFYDFLPDGLIRFNIVTLKRDGQSDWKSKVTSTYLHPQLRSDLERRLSEAGFTHIHSYGGMGGEVFNPQSSANLVITAVKK
jgi:2-polyprenyl-3-methyl-5-hydroxy-6-metoxy-1,4-benzoquinol methylase